VGYGRRHFSRAVSYLLSLAFIKCWCRSQHLLPLLSIPRRLKACMTLAERYMPELWQFTPAGTSNSHKLRARAGKHLGQEQLKSAKPATQYRTSKGQTEGRGGPAVPGSTRTQLERRKSKARRGRNRRRHERGIQQLGGMLSSRMPGQAPGEGSRSTLLLDSQPPLQHPGLSLTQ